MSPCNAIESYDTASGIWEKQSNVLVSRMFPAMLEKDGCIYMVGGLGADGGFMNNVEAFDTEKKMWKTVAPLQSKRADMSTGAPSPSSFSSSLLFFFFSSLSPSSSSLLLLFFFFSSLSPSSSSLLLLLLLFFFSSSSSLLLLLFFFFLFLFFLFLLFFPSFILSFYHLHMNLLFCAGLFHSFPPVTWCTLRFFSCISSFGLSIQLYVWLVVIFNSTPPVYNGHHSYCCCFL